MFAMKMKMLVHGIVHDVIGNVVGDILDDGDTKEHDIYICA